MTTKATLRRLPATHESAAGVKAGEHVLSDFWRELGKEGGEVQELVARRVALDLVAAQVADKDVPDREIPVAADRVVMIDGEFGHSERAAAVRASPSGEGLGDNRTHFGGRMGERLAGALGLVTVDVAGSAGERSATPPPGSSRRCDDWPASNDNRTPSRLHRARPGGATIGQLASTSATTSRLHRARPGGATIGQLASATATTSRLYRARPGGATIGWPTSSRLLLAG